MAQLGRESEIFVLCCYFFDPIFLIDFFDPIFLIQFLIFPTFILDFPYFHFGFLKVGAVISR